MIRYVEVEGYPNYRVGDDGSIWSRRNKVGNRWVDGDWRKLDPAIQADGYRYVTLHPGNRSRKVSCLIALAFHGARPKGHECCHGNGTRHDDRADNLRWGTRSENCRDRADHGTVARGERNGWVKLTTEQVAEIRSIGRSETQTAIGIRFGVSQNCISQILRRKSRKGG